MKLVTLSLILFLSLLVLGIYLIILAGNVSSVQGSVVSTICTSIGPPFSCSSVVSYTVNGSPYLRTIIEDSLSTVRTIGDAITIWYDPADPSYSGIVYTVKAQSKIIGIIIIISSLIPLYGTIRLFPIRSEE